MLCGRRGGKESVWFDCTEEAGCLIKTLYLLQKIAHWDFFFFYFQQWVEGLRSIIHNFRANNVSPMTCLKKQ